MTARILKEYPLFGIGFQHFRIRFGEYCDKASVNEIHEFRIPDNMYLTLLAESGIVGASAFFIFIVLLLKKGIMRLSGEGDKNRRGALLVPMSALIGLLLNMGAYELFYWNSPYMFFCLLCGFVSGIAGQDNKNLNSAGI